MTPTIISNQPSLLGRCSWNRISARPLCCVLVHPICLRFDGPACQSAARSDASPTSSQSPSPEVPVSPLSACRPEILTRVLFCTCHEVVAGAGVLRSVRPDMLCYGTNRVHVGRSWPVSAVEVLYAGQATAARARETITWSRALEVVGCEWSSARAMDRLGWLCS